MKIPRFYVVGEIGTGDNTLSALSAFLQANANAPQVQCYINSPGGLADEGTAMYKRLLAFPGTKDILIGEQCKSIATVLMLAGDKITASPTSKFMIHPAWCDPGPSNGERLVELGEELIEYSNRLFNYYPTKRALKVPVERLRELFDAETEFDASEALQMGLIDSVAAPARASAYRNRPAEAAPPPPIVPKQSQNKMQKPQLSLRARILNLVGKGYKMLDLTGADGSVAYTESDQLPAVGDSVMLQDGTPAPDGDYTAPDGTVVSVIGGVVAEVATPAAEGGEGESEMKALAERVKALEAENATLKAQNAEFEALKAKNAEAVELAKQAGEKIEALNLEIKALKKTVPGGGSNDPDKLAKDKGKETPKSAADRHYENALRFKDLTIQNGHGQNQ